MNNIYKFLFSILVLQLVYGCDISKDFFYSYKVASYTVDSVKRFVTFNSLISYGDYLFEFRKRINIKSAQHADSHNVTSSIYYDTIGVYLLSAKNNLYYEFDTFSLKNEILKTGKLIDKKFGAKFTTPIAENTATIFYKKPMEMFINNIKCFYAEVLSKNKNSNDSIEQKIMLIKNINFNSLYKINGIRFTDSNFCIVGISVYNLKQKQGFLEEVDAMRPLTKKEKNICESMLIKSKFCIVDTIK